ncbi:uncharacterized protein EI90DRAFT_3072168 [Cantharellus anzutake]|uniref:uncharacterized protein n=1 Tax=Cantharellus anzutake TaxID=1750568 RepID=UPI0019063ECB|nr:uncharacterized protein EI90DRAFT_3072168 [Cantharellus anzutake]KAF8325895.1 hypothetical protein EI90DRAFT_3072168 [Cantharellus anzutake]
MDQVGTLINPIPHPKTIILAIKPRVHTHTPSPNPQPPELDSLLLLASQIYKRRATKHKRINCNHDPRHVSHTYLGSFAIMDNEPRRASPHIFSCNGYRQLGYCIHRSRNYRSSAAERINHHGVSSRDFGCQYPLSSSSSSSPSSCLRPFLPANMCTVQCIRGHAIRTTTYAPQMMYSWYAFVA